MRFGGGNVTFILIRVYDRVWRGFNGEIARKKRVNKKCCL
jgi:hypothetical protein